MTSLSSTLLDATSRDADRAPSPTGSLALSADPAALLRITLDPALRALTPLHWAYELLVAIRNSDLAYVATQVREPCRGFSLSMLTEPLGPYRQTLLHVAALLNQGPILCALLGVADAAAREAAAEAALAVRSDMLAAKGGEADVVAYQTRLGAELDKVERVR